MSILFFPRYCAALALCALLMPLPVLAAPLYTVIFLPGANFGPTAMNNAGQIAGFVNTSDGNSRAVVYSGGVLQDLGAPRGSFSYANAINETGAIAGTVVIDGVAHGFRYQDGNLLDFGANTSGSGINARGDVVGGISTDTGTFGYVYSNGIVTQLPNLGTGRQGFAADINDNGTIAGSSTTDLVSSPPPYHPYLYQGGDLRDLGDLDGREVNMATAINNAGQIAGYSESRTDAHAFLYDNGVLQDLGGFGGTAVSVNDLNENGILVGTAFASPRGLIPFINDGAALVDLNTLVDPASGWLLLEAYANNDLGQIIGFGCQGDTCAVVRLDLAVPVPEPTEASLMAFGLALILGYLLVCRQRKATAVRQPIACTLTARWTKAGHPKTSVHGGG